MADNKVVFGLAIAHYSIITEGEGGGNYLWRSRCFKRSG